MKKLLKKLSFAIACSTSVFALTYYFYQPLNYDKSVSGNDKPLAYVGKVVEDIQRRPATRLLWVPVNNGEPLYNGEAIRTSEHGEVRIQFADSAQFIDLEPDSLIIFKKSEGEIALDLVEGSLFVSAEKENSANLIPLVISSVAGKLQLNGSSASLSRLNGKSLDIQVLQGKASFKSKNGETKEIPSGEVGALSTKGLDLAPSNLKIMTPVSTKPVMMDSENLKPIVFSWSGLPPDAHVQLWTGPNRKELKLNTAVLDGKSDVSTLLPFGRHHWKLVTLDKLGNIISESPVQQLEIIAQFASTVIYPITNKKIAATTEAHTPPVIADKPKPTILSFDLDTVKKVQTYVDKTVLNVSWKINDIEQVSKFIIRLRPAGEDLSKFKTVEILDKTTTASIPIPEAGKYIVSIEAIKSDGTTLTKSEDLDFSVSMLPLLQAPSFTAPPGKIQAQKNGQLVLEWSKVEGAKEYFITLKKGEKVLKQNLATTKTFVKNLPAGDYTAEVVAMDNFGRKGNISEKRMVVVPEKNLRAPASPKIMVK